MKWVRSIQQVCYTEAREIIEGANGAEDMAVDAPQTVEIQSVVQQVRETDMLIVKKVYFMVFIAHVINCTAQTNKKSKKLDMKVSFWVSRTSLLKHCK